MGFGSWVRRPWARLRQAAWSEDVRDDRPLAGLLGSPDRSAPAQAADSSAPWPTPLAPDRVAAWCARYGYSWFVDDDGDLGGIWRGRLFYFFCFGERSEILQVRGQWNRELAIERLPEALELCNAWNADRVWPKAYARVRDDGMVHVTCEVATDLEHGVTDAQLDRLLHGAVASITAFLDDVDEVYPDPAASAP